MLTNLIQDGDRLYLVSDDPQIQEAMRRLVNTEPKAMPLEPMIPETNVSNYTEAYNKFIQDFAANASGQTNDQINYLMALFSNLNNEKNTSLKNIKVQTIKTKIREHLMAIHAINWPIADKFKWIYGLLNPFSGGMINCMIQQLDKKNLTDYLNTASPERLASDFEGLYCTLMERCN